MVHGTHAAKWGETGSKCQGSIVAPYEVGKGGLVARRYFQAGLNGREGSKSI